MRPHRWCSTLALVLCASCQDDEVAQRFPIEPFLLQYNDPLTACAHPQPGTALVGAFVGSDGCELESAVIEARGDSLFVTGVARCVFRQISAPTTPPARKIPQWLTIRFPDLDPGEYTLCAGDLCGQVTVTPECDPAAVGKLYASGTFGRIDSCVVFYTAWGDWAFEARGIDSPLPVGNVRISGVPECFMPWCPEICNPFLEGILGVLSVSDEPVSRDGLP